MSRARVVLTDLLIQKMKPPSSGQVELFDLRAPGLSIRCGARGTKVFYLTYRMETDRKRRRGKLGVYPMMKLAEAREARAKLAQIGRNVDPFTPLPPTVILAPAPFDAYAERFIADHVNRKGKAPEDATRIIRNEFVSVWGDRDVRVRWIDLDLQTALWTMPAHSTKNSEPHLLPLRGPLLERFQHLRQILVAIIYLLHLAYARARRQVSAPARGPAICIGDSIDAIPRGFVWL